MGRRVRSAMVGLAACAVAASSLVLGTAAPAAAFGGETFGCRIAPGTVFTWSTYCQNSRPATTYNVGFAVLNTTGTYTYSWTVTGPYQSVITGCTSTSYDCAVSVHAEASDVEIFATVTYTQDGQSATQSARAMVIPYCDNMYC